MIHQKGVRDNRESIPGVLLASFLMGVSSFWKKEKSLKKRSEKEKNAILIFPLCSLSLTTIPHYAWYPIDRNEINNADLQSGKVTR